MELRQKNQTEHSNDSGGAPSGSPASNLAAELTDLVKRDPRFWWWAIWKKRWLLLGMALVMGLLFAAGRMLSTQKFYESRCALVRQEGTEGQSPFGLISLPKTNVIFNLMFSRNCLEETLSALKLDWSSGALFRTLSAKPAARNSNYIFLSATTTNPELSARIANTHAEVFLKQYSKLIQDTLREPRISLERNIKTLRTELSAQEQELKDFSEKYQFSLLSLERSSIGERIAMSEDRAQREQAFMDMTQTRLAELKAQLEATPQTTETFVERSMAREQALANLRVELSALRQRYTDTHPSVQQKLATIAQVEKELAQSGDAGTSRVVMGRNPEYTSLRMEIMKAEAQLSATSVNLKQSREQLDTLYERRNLLNELAPRYIMLEDQIKNKRDFLQKQENRLRELQMFLEREYSDIAIFEQALPSYSPLSRKVTFFGVIGIFFGLFLATAYALICEAVNLSVRSKADLEQALHLPAMGLIPRKASASDVHYYSALQTALVKGQEIMHQSKPPWMLALAQLGSEPSFDPQLQELLSMMELKDLTTLVIRPAPQDAINSTVLINDFLYGIQDQLPSPTARHELFFNLDDMAMITPLAPERLRRLYLLAKYDVVIWELFPYEQQPQLYSEICRTATMTVLPIQSGMVSKLAISRILHFLRQRNVNPIYGILYDVEEKVYHGVNL